MATDLTANNNAELISSDGGHHHDLNSPLQGVVNFYRNLGFAKLMAILGVTIVFLVFFIFLVLRMGGANMAPLYNNMSMEDSAQIVSELDAQGIEYELKAGGAQILVPSNELPRIRLMLAEQGLPASGTMAGYDIFDNQDGLGTSNFVHNVNLLRALEGELGRTISSLQNVENARVHLVLPQRELFTRERKEPSASVVVNMRGNTKLSASEVQAIQHLIATSVSDLKLSRITIIDEMGRLLARGVSEGGDEASIGASHAEEKRIAYENRLKNTIENLLESSLGVGKARAEINADMNFDRIIINSEDYDPDTQVARSIQNSEETERSVERNMNDNVTVGNNLPAADAGQDGVLSNRSKNRTDETTNFEISKTIKQHIQEGGTINRLSIAVLVDGTYNTLEDGTQEYVPRTGEEMEQIRTLVSSAVGFDGARGDVLEVVNLQFVRDLSPQDEGIMDFVKSNFHNYLQTILLFTIAVLAIIFVIKPLINNFIKEDRDEALASEGTTIAGALGADGSHQLADYRDEYDDDMVDFAHIEGGVKSSTIRKLNEVVEKYPEESLQVIRKWINEEAHSSKK